MTQISLKRLDATRSEFWSELEALLAWDSVSDDKVASTVREILQNVRRRGDEAVIDYTNRFDRMQAKDMRDLIIDQSRLETALNNIPAPQREALEAAAHRVRIPFC